MLDTVNGMKQFIALQKKSLSELKAIAEGLGLEVRDDKDYLLRSLIAEERPVQRDLMGNTLLAITLPSEEARNLMLKWRKNIFEQGRYKDYSFLNSKGEKYTQQFKRILLSEESVRTMIRLEMLVPKDYTRDTFLALCKSPELFCVSLVLKRQQGANWLMLCVEPKKKAA